MADNPFNTPVSGQADWDSGNSQNWAVAERGYHVTERAGSIVSTGQMVAMTSGGWMLPFNPNSPLPCVGLAFTAAASGDTLSTLAWGIVRSLSINSPALPGQLMFSNASGFLSTATLGNPVGLGLAGYGLLFNPAKSSGAGGGSLASLSDVNTNGVGSGSGLAWSNASSKWVVTQPYVRSHRVQSVQVNVVVGSLHTFNMSLGAALFGWNRRVRVNGSSASFAEVKLYRDAGLTDLQYQTFSGGIAAVNSYHDRAGWPVDTDSGTIYGTVKCFSTDVASDTLNIICDWEV